MLNAAHHLCTDPRYALRPMKTDKHNCEAHVFFTNGQNTKCCLTEYNICASWLLEKRSQHACPKCYPLNSPRKSADPVRLGHQDTKTLITDPHAHLGHLQGPLEQISLCGVGIKQNLEQLPCAAWACKQHASSMQTPRKQQQPYNPFCLRTHKAMLETPIQHANGITSSWKL